MFRSRILIMVLIFLLWMSLTASRPLAPSAAPGAFSKLTPASGAVNQSTSPTLTWQVSSGATNYQYCIRTNQNCNNKWVSVGNVTSITLSNLGVNTLYYWQVRATDATGVWTYANASSSDRWTLRTQAAPGAFNKISPANGATGQPASGLSLTWGASSGATDYQYCIDQITGTTCDTMWVSAGNVTATIAGSLTPNTVYFWQVRATNSAGTSYANANGWWSFSTYSAPGPFNKTSPADTAMNQPVSSLVLTWGTSTGAASYEYCFDTNNNNTCDTSWTANGSATTALINGLAYDMLYYWQVRAVNPGGMTEATSGAWWSFRTRVAPPAAFGKTYPGNNAVNLDPNNLVLAWTASAGAASYEYCYDTTDDSTCSSWTSTTAMSSAPLHLNFQTIYFWQVRAINPSGMTTADSGLHWMFLTRAAPPGSFTKTEPVNGGPILTISPTLGWNPSAGTNVTYEYCYDTSNNNLCDSAWRLAGTSTSVTLNGLAYNTLYYWQVRAVNDSGTTYAGGELAWWSFNTPLAPPGGFGKASPVNGTAGMVNVPTLSWGASSSATGYEVCIYVVGETPCADVGWQGTGTGTSVVVSLDYGKTYTWQVRAKNSSGSVLADNGTWWTFTVMTAPPLTFSKINPINGGSNQLLDPWIYWSSSQNATGYRYCIDTSNNNTCDTGWTPVSASATSAQVTGLARDTTYYWQVEATGSVSEEANGGTWWSFSTLPPLVTVLPGQLAYATAEETLLNGQLMANSPKGLPLSFWLVDPKPSGLLAVNIDGSFAYQPVIDFNGNLPFHFMVSDGVNVAQGPFTATIDVTAVNDAPVLGMIADQVVKTGRHVSFTASATDADLPYGDSLTFSIVEPLPAGAVFASGVFSWTPKWTNAHPQPYIFTVVVTDHGSPAHASDQQVVTVMVTPEVMLLPFLFR